MAGLTWTRLLARSTRREYWLCMVPFLVLSSVAQALSGHPAAVSLLGLPIWLVVGARRLHDIGVNAGWAWSAAVAGMVIGIVKAAFDRNPVVDQIGSAVLGIFSLGFIIGIGAWAGTPGVNRYGPPPRWRARPAEVEVFD